MSCFTLFVDLMKKQKKTKQKQSAKTVEHLIWAFEYATP